MITKLNEKNFDENIKSGLKLVEFYAPWCGYCKHQEPVLEEMGKIWIGQINSDESPNLLQRFGIQGFPSFILFREGKEIEKFSGFHTKFEIMDIMSKYLNEKI